MIKNFLYPKGHQNPISGLKVTAIFLKGCILHIGGASSGRVCPYSLRSRLVCKQADVPEGELEVVNPTTIAELCEFLETI